MSVQSVELTKIRETIEIERRTHVEQVEKLRSETQGDRNKQTEAVREWKFQNESL